MESTARHFDLVSHWRFEAPIGRVWAELTRPASWPAWWPYVRHVVEVRPGNADGLGSVRRIGWRTRLPYDLEIEVQTTEVVEHELLRARSQGELLGEGIWLLREDGAFTEVTYVWRVEVTKRWMRLLAPLLAMVFRWNHDGVMAAGERGLARHLSRGHDRAVRGSGRSRDQEETP